MYFYRGPITAHSQGSITPARCIEGMVTAARAGRFVAARLLPLLLLLPAARSAVPDAGQLLNEQRATRPLPSAGRSLPPDTEPQPPDSATAPLNGNAVADTASPSAAPGLRVTLRSIHFSGAGDLGMDRELEGFVAPSVGQTLGHADLQKLARDVTSFLRARGFILARAYLPRQDLTAGSLEIAVVEGRLQGGPRRVTVQGETRIPASRLTSVAESALPEGPLRLEDLERAVLLVNDLSGISARSALERGDAPGTTRLVIDATEGSRIAGNVAVDNFSNRATGNVRGSAQLSALDPFRMGDAFGLALSATADTRVLAASYSLPLTPSGLRLSASGSYLHYKVGEELAPLQLRGHASTGALGLNYPLLRTRKTNLYVHGEYEQKRLSDEGLGINLRQRRVDHANFDLRGNHYDDFLGGGLTEASLSFNPGKLDLSGNTVDRAGDSRTARTHGAFLKAGGQLSRLQSLGALDGGNWSVYASLAGQWADANLDSSEKFILGGPSGVRAYPVGEAPGDEGWLSSIELRRNLPASPRFKTQAFAFFDAGGVWLNHRSWAGSTLNAGHTNYVDLAGAGLGLNLWAGHWNFRAALAQAVGDNPGRTLDGRDADGRSSRQRAWFQAAFSF